MKRSLTKRVIAAAVARDLQQQLLNSKKLKEFFERNPKDKEVLKRACKQLKVLRKIRLSSSVSSVRMSGSDEKLLPFK